MNITYHTMLGVASASVIAKIIPEEHNIKIYKIGTIGVGINILLHGILDILPHNYSLTMIKDGIIALFLIAVAMFFVNNKYRLLTLCCVGGAILPDVIDKIIIKNISTVNFYVFQWHNSEIINKFYLVYIKVIPIQYFGVTDIVVVGVSLLFLILYRDKFIKSFNFKY